MTFGRNVRGILADRKPPAPAPGAARPAFGGPFAPWAIPAAGLATDPNSAVLLQEVFNISAGKVNINTDNFSNAYYKEEDATLQAVLNITNVPFGNISNIPNGSSVPWSPSFVFPTDSDGLSFSVNSTTGVTRLFVKGFYNIQTNVLTCAGATIVQRGVEKTTGDNANILEKENGTRVQRACGIADCMFRTVRDEIETGVIPHCLPYSYTNPSKFEFVAPAIKGAGGTGGAPGRGHMGMRIVFDLTQADIDNWLATRPAAARPFLRAMGTAIRDFGLLVSDHGGNRAKQISATGVEHDQTAKWSEIGVLKADVLRALYPLLQPNTSKARVLTPPVHVGGNTANVACYPGFSYPQGHPCNPF